MTLDTLCTPAVGRTVISQGRQMLDRMSKRKKGAVLPRELTLGCKVWTVHCWRCGDGLDEAFVLQENPNDFEVAALRREGHLRGPEYFAQGPHEGSIDAHELLHVYLVCLVQHHPHFVVVALQGPNHLHSNLTCSTGMPTFVVHPSEDVYTLKGISEVRSKRHILCHWDFSSHSLISLPFRQAQCKKMHLSSRKVTCFISSLMSSLWGSKSSRMRSHLAANQPQTSRKL